MPLLEVLALQFGPAIAKSILKLWLKDAGIAADVSSTFVDLLKTKTTDVIAQQRGKRQLEAIGERVAESLRPIFEDAGNQLDGASRAAVALAVAETLDKSRITPDLLVQRDLEPAALEKHLLHAHPDATSHFTAVETTLYHRIISESSQYIVDIAAQLPAFTERSFAEVLRRENQLLEKADLILEEVRRIRESSRQVNPEAEAARFETAYRRAVVRRLDELELFGADVSTASRRHRLSVAYVTLSVEQKLAPTPEDLLPRRRPAEPSDEEDEDDSRVIVPVDEALAQAQRLLLQGLAGSGKTTLLQWIAVHSAAQTFAGQLTHWNDTIPFFVLLRQCVETGLPTPEDFPRLVAPAIAGTCPGGWVHDQLASGRAIVLVDGVDEVPELQRPDVRRWLDDLIGSYPRARFVVSSRPYAVAEGWQRAGFDDAELQPMDLPDINAFIDHWHAAVHEELQEPEAKAELDDLAEHLKQAVRKSRPIRSLATTPLLCAMLCAMHRDRNRQLPSDRIELYEACCNMLLERREIERRLDLRDYPRLSYRQKRALLQDFAYWLLSNGWSDVTREKADERFALRLANMGDGLQGATGRDVRRLFVERTGMVREPVAGRIDFAHRTFQEFLAAQAALDEGDTGVLVKNAHDDQWREVIVLAAGLAGKKVRGELIGELILRGDREARPRQQLHLLAVACLETSLELEPRVKVEVQKRLARLVPPKNMTEAKALASAGELALPYLVKEKKHTTPIDAACIRALALIGGEAALDVLEGYADETRRTILAELWRAWDAFDRVAYARKILSRLSTASTALTLLGISSLEGIQSLPILTKLDLIGCGHVTDLAPLAGLSNLTKLDLTGCRHVTDLAPLAHLSNLTTLDLSRCRQVTDLVPLAHLSTLTTLDLSGCERVIDLAPLAGLSTLTTLSLYYCRKVRDLSPLAGLSTLITLNLSYCSQVTDLAPLAHLSNLTTLDLSSCWEVRDLAPLAGLSNLTTLNLRGCEQVRDFRPLLGLANLRELRLPPNVYAPSELWKIVKR